MRSEDVHTKAGLTPTRTPWWTCSAWSAGSGRTASCTDSGRESTHLSLGFYGRWLCFRASPLDIILFHLLRQCDFLHRTGHAIKINHIWFIYHQGRKVRLLGMALLPWEPHWEAALLIKLLPSPINTGRPGLTFVGTQLCCQWGSLILTGRIHFLPLSFQFETPQ